MERHIDRPLGLARVLVAAVGGSVGFDHAVGYYDETRDLSPEVQDETARLLSEEFVGKGDDAADPLADRAEMQRRLDELNVAMANYGGGTEGLERQLEIVRDGLLSARELVRIETRTLRVDAMNTVLDEAQSAGQTVGFVHVQAPRIIRALAAVRVQRADVPAGGLSNATVERTL